MLLTLGAVGEVVKNFKDHDCKKFFLDEEPPEFKMGTGSEGRYVQICQRYSNEYHYATLYDTTEKIPGFSAYRYEKGLDCDVDRPVKTWMIEPQLEEEGGSPAMALQGSRITKGLQAYNRDYKLSKHDRGHLYPVCHTPTQVAAESTFTLTNAAPQKCDFNRNWYDEVESKVTPVLNECVNKGTACVVTGGSVSVSDCGLQRKRRAERRAVFVSERLCLLGLSVIYSVN
ncbi:hypothetical protein SRHO_G00103420 [Serrasalmus rhombeus]